MLADTLALARDLSGLAFGLIVTLLVVLLSASPAGVAGGVAASIAAAALGGVTALGIHGLVSGGLGAAAGVSAALVAGLALVAAIVGAQVFGVRGLWYALAAAVGAGVAWLVLGAFYRSLAGAFGAFAPLVAFLAFTALAFAALSAVSRAATGLGSEPLAAARGAPLTARLAPPLWFDCAYGALGGASERDGLCRFTPPLPRSLPPWAVARASAPGRDAPIDPASAGPDPTPLGDARTVLAEAAAVRVPETPAVSTPDFSAILTDQTAVVARPGALAETLRPPEAPPAPATAPDGAPPPEPTPGEAPGALDAAAGVEAPPAVDAPEGPAIRVAAAPLNDPSGAQRPPTAPTSAPAERLRTEYVCFPMLDAIAERLCPDQRLGERDVTVAWRDADGAALAAVDELSCHVEPNAAVHATLLAHLSGGLAGVARPEAGAGGAAGRKIDAIYDGVTRMLGAARADLDADDGRRLHLSLFVANGSKLLSPWAARTFGPDAVDRVFDVASGGQTLELLRRLRAESQLVRRDMSATPLGDALLAALRDRPAAPSETTQDVIVAFVDAEADAPDAARTDAVAVELKRIGAPLFLLVLGPTGPGPAWRAFAEATGGAALPAGDAATLFSALRRVLARARSFCAVRVTAPNDFFDRAALEVTVRRRTIDGCVFEQTVRQACGPLSYSQRLLPAPNAGN